MKFYLVVCVSFGQKNTSQCGAGGGRAREAAGPCQDLTGSSQLQALKAGSSQECPLTSLLHLCSFGQTPCIAGCLSQPRAAKLGPAPKPSGTHLRSWCSFRKLSGGANSLEVGLSEGLHDLCALLF